MNELSNACQWKDELIVDFIERWRTLNLNCKDWISQSSTIEMYIQGMHWRLSYILQGIQLETFDKLSTKAHKMVINLEGQEHLLLILTKPWWSHNQNMGARLLQILKNPWWQVLHKSKPLQRKEQKWLENPVIYKKVGAKEKPLKICTKNGIHLVTLMSQKYFMISYKRNLLSYQGQGILTFEDKNNVCTYEVLPSRGGIEYH